MNLVTTMSIIQCDNLFITYYHIHQPFKCHLYGVVEHNQTICWLLLMDCLSVFDRFVGLALKGLIFFLSYIMLDLYLYFFVMFIFTYTFDVKFNSYKLFFRNKIGDYLLSSSSEPSTASYTFVLGGYTVIT